MRRFWTSRHSFSPPTKRPAPWNAETLYQLLDAVLEPTDRGAVRRAFATPLVGMRAPDLYRLESEPDAWQTEVEQLRTLRELWLEHGPARLFRELLARYQWPGKLLATDDGPRALTNLLHLSDVLQGWALSERLGPAGLMRRFRAARDAATEARQLRLESDADAVRVVTMHSAKGLEYPFVYAPFLWQGSGLGAVERRVLRGNDPDPPYAPYLDLSVTLDQPPKQDRIEATDAALRAEGMRLLYVAITRARHRAVVYHIAARGAQHGPLARLIYDGVVQFQRRSDERLATEARRLTDGCDHADVSLAEPPEPQSAPEAPEVRLPSVRSFHPHWLDHWWRRGSFSQLKKGDVMPDPGPDGEGVDHEDDDDDTPAALPVATPTDAPDVPLAGLEASRRFGDCVHDILEHAPFDAGDDGLRPWATRYAARYGYAAEVVDPLVAGLLVALDTPLGPGESPLSSVPMTDRLNELHFDFSVAGGQAPIKSSRVTNRNLAAVLRRHLDPAGPVPTTYADAVGRLRFFPLQGFMTGDIDLVFRHGDRWWLVDHKTSRLGPKPADYAPARLQAHMAARHYVLQYHLYVVALHRWLSVRLLDYDYDRDFGGVRYLYLRGMCGPAGSGVFADRPPRALVEALDALFTDPAAMEADG